MRHCIEQQKVRGAGRRVTAFSRLPAPSWQASHAPHTPLKNVCDVLCIEKHWAIRMTRHLKHGGVPFSLYLPQTRKPPRAKVFCAALSTEQPKHFPRFLAAPCSMRICSVSIGLKRRPTSTLRKTKKPILDFHTRTSREWEIPHKGKAPRSRRHEKQRQTAQNNNTRRKRAWHRQRPQPPLRTVSAGR